MPRVKKSEIAEPQNDVVEAVPTNVRPAITDQLWSDWVLGQLRQEEKDPEGNPNVDGLRRLTEEILGPVVYSVPEQVVGAETSNQMRATVIHRVKIQWQGDRNDIREFGAAADVYTGNTDEEYARYAAATADTRAEARALRKALRLKKVVAAEEITSLPVTESGLNLYIVNSQIRGINKLCKDMDINVVKFINSGQNKYKHITHIKYTTAQSMLEQLNRYLQNMSRIPEDIKEYDPNWRQDTDQE